MLKDEWMESRTLEEFSSSSSEEIHDESTSNVLFERMIMIGEWYSEESSSSRIYE